jgi:hypothetical protein
VYQANYGLLKTSDWLFESGSYGIVGPRILTGMDTKYGRVTINCSGMIHNPTLMILIYTIIIPITSMFLRISSIIGYRHLR